MSDLQLPPRTPRPREQLPIALFEGVVLAARADDGRIYIGLRDLCATLGLKVSGQRRRILADESLHLIQFRVQSDGQFRTMDFLLLEDVPIWLLGVQQARVSKEVQERFRYVKTYLVRAVQRAFAELAGVADAPSSAIEDLADLDRIEQAFTQLAELGRRQEATDARLDRARGAFRDIQVILAELQERVREIERQVNAPLSPTQRGTVYQMVQQWGIVRAEHDTKLPVGSGIRKCWAELNAAFGVATYTHLPSARYGEIVAYITNQYRTITGRDIKVLEQTGMQEYDET